MSKFVEFKTKYNYALCEFRNTNRTDGRGEIEFKADIGDMHLVAL